MFKNVASQKIQLFAFDTTTGAPKTGDSANITAYVQKDHGAVTVLGDTSATEADATNAKGCYTFDLTQAETNADTLAFTAKSSTANVSITPVLNMQTYPASFGAFVTPTGAAVNTTQLAGQTVTAAAGVTFPTSVASPTNITAGTITTATNVTTVNGLAAGVITAASIAADAITDAKVASDVTIASVTGSVGSVTGAVGSVTGAVGSVTGAVGSVTGNVGGNVTGSVGSIATGGIAAASFAAGAIDAAAIASNAITAAKIATDAIDADALAADAVAEIQSGLATASALTTVGSNVTSVKTTTDLLQTMIELAPGSPTYYRFKAGAVEMTWEVAAAGHGSGTTGEALAAAGAAGDPWITALPGAYSAGSAGFIIGTNLDATVSSRLASASYTAPLDAAGTRSAVGLASANLDTQLDALPTNAELATALGTADDATLSAIGALSIPTTAQIADKILGRNLAGGSDGTRTVQDALRSLRNKTSISGGTLTVCQEDDSTPAWTAAVTTTAGDPLSAIDPA